MQIRIYRRSADRIRLTGSPADFIELVILRGRVCAIFYPGFQTSPVSVIRRSIVEEEIARRYSVFYTLQRKYYRGVHYQEVWKNPVQQLATKYGASDVWVGESLEKTWSSTFRTWLLGEKKTANGRRCKCK